MNKQLYFQIRVEDEPFVIEECGKFTIFLSIRKDGLDPAECDDEIEDLLGVELMEGIWAINSLEGCDTVEGIRNILQSHGFIESHNLNNEGE